METAFSLSQVVDLERPAEHLDAHGKLDYTYDGINFWCERDGKACPLDRQAPPREGWRHKDKCRCAVCRERRKAGTAAPPSRSSSTTRRQARHGPPGRSP